MHDFKPASKLFYRKKNISFKFLLTLLFNALESVMKSSLWSFIAQIVNGFSIFLETSKNLISDVCRECRKAVNYFCKKAPS